MTINEFNLLPDEERAAAIYENGAYIGQRNVEYYNILLYQLDAFFVELFYNDNSNEIAHINWFNDKDQLSFLLHQEFPSLN